MSHHRPHPQPKSWPWAVVAALLASIPAFYDSLMPHPAVWANGLYLLSGLVLMGSLWQSVRAAPLKRSTWQSMQVADLLLALALLVSAVLPSSHDSVTALGWRLTVALATLLKLIVLCQPLLSRAGLVRMLAIAMGVLALCGVGFYLIDPTVKTISEGLWLAFTTAATVGYGDVIPSTTASRIFAVFVVLLGYGVLSLVTAGIAAVFVGSQERQVEHEILRDMHTQLTLVKHEIAALRKEVEAARGTSPAASTTSITDRTSDSRCHP